MTLEAFDQATASTKVKDVTGLAETLPNMATARRGRTGFALPGERRRWALALTEPVPFLDVAFRVSTASAAAIASVSDRRPPSL